MTVLLSPAAAQQKLDEIESHRVEIVKRLDNISQTQGAMLGSSWHGGSADTYGKTAMQQQDDFAEIVKAINNVTDLATQHIHSVTNQDNG
jgi:uncharacterized protein YukE